jgi:hypothetical protein
MPIDAYITFHEIFTLSAMKNCLIKNDFVNSYSIYNNSALNQLISFWDILFSSWRQILNGMVSNPLTYPIPDPVLLNDDKIVVIKNTLEDKEKTIYNYEISVNLVFKNFAERLIDKDETKNTLIELRKKSLELIRKVHPDKNIQEQEQASHLTKRINAIKSEIDAWIQLLENDNFSNDDLILYLSNKPSLSREENAVLNDLKLWKHMDAIVEQQTFQAVELESIAQEIQIIKEMEAQQENKIEQLLQDKTEQKNINEQLLQDNVEQKNINEQLRCEQAQQKQEQAQKMDMMFLTMQKMQEQIEKSFPQQSNESSGKGNSFFG